MAKETMTGPGVRFMRRFNARYPEGASGRPHDTRLGVVFSPEEMRAMRRAMTGAAEFMEGYGSGIEPYMVDTSRYENTSGDRI